MKKWLYKKNYKNNKRFKKYWKDEHLPVKIVLTLLILGLMLLSGALVWSLACGYACSGAQATANLVLVFGTLGILGLGGLLIFRVFTKIPGKSKTAS